MLKNEAGSEAVPSSVGPYDSFSFILNTKKIEPFLFEQANKGEDIKSKEKVLNSGKGASI